MAEETPRPLTETEAIDRIRREGIEGAVAKMERAEQWRQEWRRERPFLCFVEVDNELAKVERVLRKTGRLSEGVAFSQEQRNVLAPRAGTMRRLVEAMDRDIVGAYSPDWGKLRPVVDEK